jgi:CheY-like chemotaxis protein
MPQKLLLADDSVTIQRVIELTFADEDVQVIAVGDGRQAIERIEAERPDIVLADVGMPERDGYEVAAYVKRTPHLAHIPVLLLTGAFEPVDEKRASEVGCDGVLAKPFEPQMVITRVKELLADAPPTRMAPVLRKTEDLGAPAAVAPPPVPVAPPPPPDSEPPTLLTVPESRVKTVDLEVVQHLPTPVPEASELPAGLERLEPPVVDETDALVESPLDAAVRISRRTPIAVPGFGAPAAPPAGKPAESLDDYFDRLDAAFASLQSGPAVAPAPEPAADVLRLPEPTAPPVDAETLLSPHSAIPADRESAAAPVAGPLADAPQPSPVAPAAPHAPVIAQAFSALFAAERGEAEAGPSSYYQPPAPPPQVSTDELVERVAHLVIERLSDRVVRDTVADIVSRVAERLVRDEIDRVKSTIK